MVPPDIEIVPAEVPPPPFAPVKLSVPSLMAMALTHVPVSYPRPQAVGALTVAPLLMVRLPRMTPVPPPVPNASVPALTVVPPV